MRKRLTTIALIAAGIIAIVAVVTVMQWPIIQREGTVSATTKQAIRNQQPLIQATATSTLYNATTLAAPGTIFPCEYDVLTPPTPTVEGVYSITPDKSAGIGSIIDASLDNPFMKDFRTANVWSAYINQTTVIVYSGGRISKSKEGGVFIQWGNPGDGTPVRPYRYHPTPELHGAVHVIEANEVTLTLESEDGVQFRFNVCDEVYVK